MMRYSELLVRSGLTKDALARALGVRAGTVSAWRDERVPGYVVAYLRVRIELDAMKALEALRRPVVGVANEVGDLP